MTSRRGEAETGPVWLRRDTGGEWKKAVVDVKVASTDKMNGSFKEKDDKYCEWATQETHEKKVTKAVMAPFIISQVGAVREDSVRRWKDFVSDIEVDRVRMAQCPPQQSGHCGEVLQ